ncbi:hypothetical protein WJX81_001861 [Elliptochloris bilobata]|uniref:Heme O synthase n=1 Tax=Elliptochloris bilobata TaxID=381761 RepID=A0AAW1RLE3_9CHLO
MGSGDAVDWRSLAWASLGTFGCAAAANTLNQVYEVANDALMKRTMRRPLPTGRVSPRHALAFASVTGAAGVAILYYKANALTAGLGAANIALYAGVYTPLKVVSCANTWLGAAVGAVPPLMGWAAAAGTLEPGAGVLAAALYFWQLPHFLALAWLCRGDYAAGGYRMLSLVDATGRRTAACALRNCAYLVPVGFAAVWLGVATPTFGGGAALLAGVFALPAAAFYQAPSNAAARTLFRASLAYLPLFMAGLIASRVPNTHEASARSRLQLRLPGASQRSYLVRSFLGDF